MIPETLFIPLVVFTVALLGIFLVYITGNRSQTKKLIATNNGLYNKLVEYENTILELRELAEQSKDIKESLIRQNEKLLANIAEAGAMIGELDIATTEKIRIVTRLNQ